MDAGGTEGTMANTQPPSPPMRAQKKIFCHLLTQAGLHAGLSALASLPILPFFPANPLHAEPRYVPDGEEC